MALVFERLAGSLYAAVEPGGNLVLAETLHPEYHQRIVVQAADVGDLVAFIRRRFHEEGKPR